MAVVLSHPTGNSFVRAIANGLLEANTLAEFHTSIASFPGSFFDRLGGIKSLSEIRRRRYDTALGPFTHTWPWREVGRLVASKIGVTSLTKHESGIFCVDAVYREIDKNVAAGLQKSMKRGVKAIYAYEDEALLSFRKAKQLKVSCLYDLPIGYWRAARNLLETEQERWPQWMSTMPNFMDSENKLLRKDEELKLADRIFVASNFTAKTLKEFPGKLAPVEVIAYGFPQVIKERNYSSVSGRPLKLLFVGGLSQRKGIADVFAVAEKLGNKIELTIVGRKMNENCTELNTSLLKHTWIPSLPQSKILELMRENDVLVFPSLFEGFGMVITEAMSQGTPVITTDRTVGPDFIQHGHNGWLIQAGSTEALLNAVEDILYHPESIAKAGKEAMTTARLRPWSIYGQELAMAIKNHLETK